MQQYRNTFSFKRQLTRVVAGAAAVAALSGVVGVHSASAKSVPCRGSHPAHISAPIAEPLNFIGSSRIPNVYGFEAIRACQTLGRAGFNKVNWLSNNGMRVDSGHKWKVDRVTPGIGSFYDTNKTVTVNVSLM